MQRILALILIALWATGCSTPPVTGTSGPDKVASSPANSSPSPAGADQGTPSADPSAGPDQATAARTLRELARCLEEGDTAGAAKLVRIPDGMPADKVDVELKKTLERQEISSAGVELLVARGKFGKASEVFPEQADGWAKRNGVAVEECWAFSLDPAEAVLYWNGQAFQTIRFDDIGKLK